MQPEMRGQHIEQFSLPHRFAQEIADSGRHRRAPLLFEGASRKHHDLWPRLARLSLDPLRGLQAIQFRHSPVHDDQIGSKTRRQFDRLDAVGSFGEDKAERTQELDQQLARIGIVIGNQDAFAVIERARCRAVLVRRHLSLFEHRQQQDKTEGRADSRSRFHLELAAHHRQVLPRNGEPQAGTGRGGVRHDLGEGLEDPFLVLGRDADSRVTYFDRQSPGTVFGGFSSNGQGDAALPGEVDGIAEQIEQYLP
ncbi:MAG: hypothetical protein CAPSK01_001611 [Candidatus Accumulibacter vicinus]|uniref:Uncharacterized protein n=1 Tax=Candidatus Accumulibacter vicinus TaxID=2954382 RepID=A0A084Y213_9PROT|nr:MAG: hypothetical protein CAPSK01_001611 [Candidatus Accumulibacter vicinus]